MQSLIAEIQATTVAAAFYRGWLDHGEADQSIFGALGVPLGSPMAHEVAAAYNAAHNGAFTPGWF